MQPVYGVYVLTNIEMEGVVKIGMTERHLKERLSELNKSSGLLGVLECGLFVHCEHPSVLEKKLHNYFKGKHINREYYRVSVQEVQRVALELLNGEDYEIAIDPATIKKEQCAQEAVKNSADREDAPVNRYKYEVARYRSGKKI